MSRESESSISFGFGLFAGVLAGVALGVLYSPKSGEAMRKDLKEATDTLTEKVPPEVVEAKDISLEVLDKVKCQVEAQLSRVQEALKAKRMAVAKEKEEAESGIEIVGE